MNKAQRDAYEKEYCGMTGMSGVPENPPDYEGYDAWLNAVEKKRTIGLQCSACGERGMERVGRRLYRCTAQMCPREGATRMLFVRDGCVFTMPLPSALAIEGF